MNLQHHFIQRASERIYNKMYEAICDREDVAIACYNTHVAFIEICTDPLDNVEVNVWPDERCAREFPNIVAALTEATPKWADVKKVVLQRSRRDEP